MTTGAAIAAAARPGTAGEPAGNGDKAGAVGVITHEGGAHLGLYFASLAQAEEVTSVVLSDPSGKSVPEARRALGEKLSDVYSDPAVMLNRAKPLMALVSMEPSAAPSAIDAALDAGCHVFAEKPACLCVEDFRTLVAKADQRGRHLMLALANRLHPAIQEARRLVRAGEIGRIFGLEMHLIADQTRLAGAAYQASWYAQKARAGGGHLIWLGIHWLDLATYVTGSKIREVSAFTANVGGQPVDIEDSAALTMRFDNGTLGTHTSGYYLDRGYHEHIKIWGSSGWMHLDLLAAVPLTWCGTKGERASQVQEFESPKGPTGYPPFVRAAFRACAGLQDPPITAVESLDALANVFAAYEAAKSGQTQRVG
ncbi:MAG: Gfo/Idh/MocA family oxidoreductase [Planctomycetota bacterium]